MKIYSQVRLGVTPEINAVCTHHDRASSTLGVIVASIVTKARAPRRLVSARLVRQRRSGTRHGPAQRRPRCVNGRAAASRRRRRTPRAAIVARPGRGRRRARPTQPVASAVKAGVTTLARSMHADAAGEATASRRARSTGRRPRSRQRPASPARSPAAQLGEPEERNRAVARCSRLRVAGKPVDERAEVEPPRVRRRSSGRGGAGDARGQAEQRRGLGEAATSVARNCASNAASGRVGGIDDRQIAGEAAAIEDGAGEPISSRASRSDTLAAVVAGATARRAARYPAESRMSARKSREPVGVERRRRASLRRAEGGATGRRNRASGRACAKASVPVISGCCRAAIFERAGGAVAVERELGVLDRRGMLSRNVAAPKRLAGPSVEPGPIGLPSQAAKRRSDGVDSFSAPASSGAG